MRAFEASRISTKQPRRRFSSASSSLNDSWSVEMPAARYASRLRPVTPGAWPSARVASARLASSRSSPAMTAGKFIISATPSVRRRRRIDSMSPSVNGRRGVSNGLAGTHDGAITNTSSGTPSQASSSQCTPSVPSTFAISCGSQTIAVVPCAITSRANSATVSFDDSMCMWASMNPGTR